MIRLLFIEFSKRWNQVFGFVVLLICLLSMGGCGPYSAITWLTTPKEKIRVVVPNRFEGVILIGWQIPDGELVEKINDEWVYRLQDDGAIILANEPPGQIISWEFWYAGADESSDMKQIPTSSCFESDKDTGVVVCSGMKGDIHNGQKLRPNATFIITTLDDYLKGRWDLETEFFRLFNKYLDRLTVSADEGK